MFQARREWGRCACVCVYLYHLFNPFPSLSTTPLSPKKQPKPTRRRRWRWCGRRCRTRCRQVIHDMIYTPPQSARTWIRYKTKQNDLFVCLVLPAACCRCTGAAGELIINSTTPSNDLCVCVCFLVLQVVLENDAKLEGLAKASEALTEQAKARGPRRFGCVVGWGREMVVTRFVFVFCLWGVRC